MKFKFLIILILTANIWATTTNQNAYLAPLIDDKDWQLEKTFDDSVRLYSKEIKSFNLKAYRVEKPTTADRYSLLSAFENVDQYTQILASASNITFATIEKNENKTLAYQHINIPLINNRHYFYHLFKSTPQQKYAYWQLTEVEQEILSQVINDYNFDGDPVKLNRGAGIYRVKERNDKNIAQYSLYLDPEGNIPSFLANMANKNGLVNMFRDLLNYSELEN